MIVTFYSFKGGVGRSMALANIARQFQLCGLNVVIVDWDLEAPGLETFFSADKAKQAAWRNRVGLIDLLQLYRHDFPSVGFDLSEAGVERSRTVEGRKADTKMLHEVLPPLQFSLQELPPPAGAEGAGKLRLLTSGWREGDHFDSYATAVQMFDWDRFYKEYRGHAYFDWMRESLLSPEIADIVLVDSRTGVTEMGNVCTRHLADVVAVFAAPNRQNIDGATQMTERFRRAEVMKDRDGRSLDIVMVPSRVDVSSSEVKKAFETDFRAASTPFIPERLTPLDVDFWELRIPYVTKFAFLEVLSVGETDGDADLNAAYREIAATIAWLAPDTSRVKRLMRSELGAVFGEDAVRALIDIRQNFDNGMAQVPSDRSDDVRELLLRLVQPAANPDEADRERPHRKAALEPHFSAAIESALEASLVKVEVASDGSELLQLREPDFVQRSKLKNWIERDRAFLSWRHRLRTYLEDWERNRDRGALLQGKLLEEAEQYLRLAHARLLGDERDFIERSVEAVKQDEERRQEIAAQAKLAEEARFTKITNWIAVVVSIGALGYIFGSQIWNKRSPEQATPPNTVTTAPDESLLRSAQVRTDAGDHAGAIDLYSKALALDPKSARVLGLRARAYLQIGNAKAALADVDRALAISPSDELYLLRAYAHSAQDPRLALQDLDQIKDKDGKAYRESRTLRAELYENSGEDAKAIETYREILSRSPDASEPSLRLAQIYERQDRKKEAVSIYQGLIKVSTDPRTLELARARLVKINPQIEVKPVAQPRVFLHLSARVDASLANPIETGLRGLGVTLAKGPQGTAYDVVGEGKTRGDVRYYHPEDETLAKRVQTATQDSLAKQGIDQTLTLIFINAEKQKIANVQRGTIEIWLPPLTITWSGKDPNRPPITRSLPPSRS